MCEYWPKEPQVPPLRFAPVGMTILLRGQVFLAEALAVITELSSRPERSVVEGPAVLSAGTHTRSLVPEALPNQLLHSTRIRT